MMTNWLPNMSQGSGPLYVRLAERIEEAIASGTLPAGTKLPPQRDLAFDIGVTIGTVGRAYSLVRERGLVSGEVGRGTFVLGDEPDRQIASVADRGIRRRRACPCPAGQAAHGQHVGARRRPERGDRKADRRDRCARIPTKWSTIRACGRVLAASRSALAEIGQLDAGPQFDRLDDRRACGRARPSSPP